MSGSRRTTQARARGPLRVIGGRLRGRQVVFPAAEGLRPTPDRVRETLFNWLMPVITDAVCLDAFAGSGILGIESLSRSAKHVTFVEVSRGTATHLKQQLAALSVSDRAHVQVAHMPQVALSGPFDLVFLDPPFKESMWADCWAWLLQDDRLSEDAWVYCESDHALTATDWPAGWEVHRVTKAGAVHATLLKRSR